MTPRAMGIGEGEDCGWLVTSCEGATSEQGLGRGVADILGVDVALADEGGFEAGSAQRVKPTEQTLPFGVGRRCLQRVGQNPEVPREAGRHERDSLMPQVDDVLRGGPSAEPVIDVDARYARGGGLIHEHQGSRRRSSLRRRWSPGCRSRPGRRRRRHLALARCPPGVQQTTR